MTLEPEANSEHSGEHRPQDDDRNRHDHPGHDPLAMGHAEHAHAMPVCDESATASSMGRDHGAMGHAGHSEMAQEF